MSIYEELARAMDAARRQAIASRRAHAALAEQLLAEIGIRLDLPADALRLLPLEQPVFNPAEREVERAADYDDYDYDGYRVRFEVRLAEQPIICQLHLQEDGGEWTAHIGREGVEVTVDPATQEGFKALAGEFRESLRHFLREEAPRQLFTLKAPDYLELDPPDPDEEA